MSWLTRTGRSWPPPRSQCSCSPPGGPGGAGGRSPRGWALSAGIELTQLLFLSWRSPSLTDIRWNSLGAVLGFSLWLAGRAESLEETLSILSDPDAIEGIRQGEAALAAGDYVEGADAARDLLNKRRRTSTA